MNNQDLKLSFKTVWFLVIGNFLFTFFGAISKLQSWDYSEIYLMIGVILFFTTWLIILIDMVRNKINNKTLWIMSMFIIPSLAQIYYMIQRDKLIEIRQRWWCEENVRNKCIRYSVPILIGIRIVTHSLWDPEINSGWRLMIKLYLLVR